LRRALRAIQEVSALADLIELRVDYLERPDMFTLLDGRQKPFIVTNRRNGEGGRYHGDEKSRLSILKEAIDLGADYVDVEIRSKRSFLRALMGTKKETQVILSYHDFRVSPSPKELQRICNAMIGLEPEIVKVVTYARSWEDNLAILSLIPYAQKRDQKIIAFCMGEKGKVSRVLAAFMGSLWTYAPCREGRASAPGQLTVKRIEKLWSMLR
jgi:3-dehydroquinate dehydratase type I